MASETEEVVSPSYWNTHDQILSILEEGHNADSIYLDFAKPFDKVDTGILCHKLRSMGISGKLGIFLHNFLSNRKQSILLNIIKCKKWGTPGYCTWSDFIPYFDK